MSESLKLEPSRKLDSNGTVTVNEENTHIIANNVDEEVNEDYMIITDGKNLPSQLTHCRELFSFFSNYKEITHTTASLVGTLAAVSMIGAGRVRTFTNSPVTVYLAYIAPTASSKDPVIKGLRVIDREVNLENTIVKSGSGLQSSGAINTMLRDCTGQLFITIDEFGDVLGEILKGSNNSKGTLKAPLKEMHSVEFNDVYEGAVYSDQGGKIKAPDPVRIKALAFGIVGITTKDQLMTHVEHKYLSDGTLNRFIFVDGTHHSSTHSGGYGEYNLPPMLIDHLATFQIIDEESKMLRLDDEALIYWNHGIGDHRLNTGEISQWCNEDSIKTSLAARVKLNALRLSTAIAYFERFETIPKWLLEWCFNFTLLSVDNFFRLYNADEEHTELDEAISAVMYWFEKHKGEHISKTYLARSATRLKKMRSRERANFLGELVERGLICHNKDDTYSFLCYP